ncbi:MAG: hypothetical protein JWL59_1518 [Chthoniobacteraceae bacterium]|nr:hypothetical protein [Chthoniobacteraceae bacterium]
MKAPTPKKQILPSAATRRRINLSKLLLAAYVRHARDPLTRLAVRQCIG